MKQREEKEKQKRLKFLAVYAKAFQMFKDKKSLMDVDIEFDCETCLVKFLCSISTTSRMNGLVTMYQELKDDFPRFFHPYRRIKKEGLLTKQDITDLLQNQQRLLDLDKE